MKKGTEMASDKLRDYELAPGVLRPEVAAAVVEGLRRALALPRRVRTACSVCGYCRVVGRGTCAWCGASGRERKGGGQ